jgi:hypothetical protein
MVDLLLLKVRLCSDVIVSGSGRLSVSVPSTFSGISVFESTLNTIGQVFCHQCGMNE